MLLGARCGRKIDTVLTLCPVQTAIANDTWKNLGNNVLKRQRSKIPQADNVLDTGPERTQATLLTMEGVEESALYKIKKRSKSGISEERKIFTNQLKSMPCSSQSAYAYSHYKQRKFQHSISTGTQ